MSVNKLEELTPTNFDKVIKFLKEQADELREIMPIKGKLGDKKRKEITYKVLISCLDRNLVFWEGKIDGEEKPIPTEFRAHFFGSKCYPDLAIGEPGKFFVAIEVGEGEGDDLKMELLKASVHAVMGKFDRSILVFLRSKKFREYDFAASEEDIFWLRFYRSLFRLDTVVI